MTILGLDHAQITIPTGAEQQAKAFYLDLLGLVEIEKPEALQGRGGFWMKAGPMEVHIGTEKGVDRMQTKAHLAYQVPDVNPWRETLEQAGVDIIEAAAIPGAERFEFRDPFGNRVELIQRLHPQARTGDSQ
ncbi:VOC family protein [Alkalicoccus chagannorensis]|uniref:VOC family protein n=1 Tax=Alkalicoccus chagannorensis TaxID=427072 RepID=UPI00047AC599|nr:VOC family protein [Alkalicoccus chagannorensis]